MMGKKDLLLHRTIQSIRSARRRIDTTVISIGLVPTMGALHEGHLSLVRQAKLENDVVIASVFVNPTQFAAGEDLDRYPRQLQQDSEKLSSLGVDHLFAPTTDDMYCSHHSTFVQPEGFGNTSEGLARPGHFRGVATIVTKLFNIVQPTRAYFGQKDAAQCVLIRRITEDLNMDVSIVVRPTIRESDGLAMSSRNAYLSSEEREAAPILYKALCSAREVFDSLATSADIESLQLQDCVRRTLNSQPLVKEIQYVSVDCRATMRSLERVTRKEGAILSIACVLGSVRLIDNIVLA